MSRMFQAAVSSEVSFSGHDSLGSWRHPQCTEGAGSAQGLG